MQFVCPLPPAQQAYHLEKDRFTSNLESTGVGKADPANSSYSLFGAPDRYPAVMQLALPKSPELSTFIGFVYFGPPCPSGARSTTKILKKESRSPAHSDSPRQVSTLAQTPHRKMTDKPHSPYRINFSFKVIASGITKMTW